MKVPLTPDKIGGSGWSSSLTRLKQSGVIPVLLKSESFSLHLAVPFLKLPRRFQTFGKVRECVFVFALKKPTTYLASKGSAYFV